MLTLADLDHDQHAAINFIAEGEDTLLAADVGTGKTVIAYTAAYEALNNNEVNRWLVLAPKLVATDTWRKEPGYWTHLDSDDVAIACGSEKDRLAALAADKPFTVTNYENLPWLLKHYPKRHQKDALPFDGLIADEVDKLKAVTSNRFRDFRNRIKVFRKRIGMTGTLIPNDLTELWGQVFMVDGGESFADERTPDNQRVARSFYQWRRAFFYPTDFNQYNWAPFDTTRDRLLALIDGLVYRLKAHGIPPLVAAPPARLTLPAAVQARYKALEDDLYLLLDDPKGKKREVEAANMAVLQGKLQQICAGFSYVDRTKEAVWHSAERFDWLDSLLYDRLGDEQVLIFYHFNEEYDELLRRYPDLPSLGSNVSDSKKQSYIDKWNNGELDTLAMHPASAGHGLNLQHSGAHHLAYLTMPWSGGMYRQAGGRLARRGQTAEEVTVHTALNRDTVDEAVFARLTDKMDTMDDFLDALEERQRARSV